SSGMLAGQQGDPRGARDACRRAGLEVGSDLVKRQRALEIAAPVIERARLVGVVGKLDGFRLPVLEPWKAHEDFCSSIGLAVAEKELAELRVEFLRRWLQSDAFGILLLVRLVF